MLRASGRRGRREDREYLLKKVRHVRDADHKQEKCKSIQQVKEPTKGGLMGLWKDLLQIDEFPALTFSDIIA